MGAGNKLLKCSGGTRILQFMIEINIFDFMRRTLMLFKDHMVLDGATMTSWYFFSRAWINELNFWAFTFKGGILFQRDSIGIGTSMKNNPKGNKVQYCNK